MGWLPERVVFDRIKTNHLEAHKGRPITDAEFKLMLEACDTVCKRQGRVYLEVPLARSLAQWIAAGGREMNSQLGRP